MTDDYTLKTLDGAVTLRKPAILYRILIKLFDTIYGMI